MTSYEFLDKLEKVRPELARELSTMSIAQGHDVLNEATGLNLPGSYSAGAGLDAYWEVLRREVQP